MLPIKMNALTYVLLIEFCYEIIVNDNIRKQYFLGCNTLQLLFVNIS